MWQCYNSAMTRRTLTTLAVVFVLALLAQGGYMLWSMYAEQRAQELAAAERALERQERTRALGAVLREGVPELSEFQIQQGFWYARGDGAEEDIFFMDVATLVDEGVSDAEARRLAGSIRESRIANREAMRVLRNDELPTQMQFHNSIYTFGETGNMRTLRAELQAMRDSGEYTADDLFRLSYLYELEGNYDARDAVRALSCEEFGTQCAGDVTVSITGSVVSGDGTPVQDAGVSILSRPDVPQTRTDENGTFTFEVSVSELEKLRIGAAKRNFSEGVAALVIASTVKREYTLAPIVVESPIGIVTVDQQAGTITGDGNMFLPDGSMVIRTPQSTYEIPANGIVRRNGEVYNGVFDVYLYEFTKDTVPESLLLVDTFDDVIGYAGDLMQTFGMPYVQFFAPDGEELHVLERNPMTLTYQIPHMQALFDNADNIYWPLTIADMQRLVDASASSRERYPITREFLIENGLINFPAFWVYDRNAGVWEGVGMRVNNLDGEIESPFYTLRL